MQGFTFATSQAVPDDVARAASSADLGPLVQVHVPRRLSVAALVFDIVTGLGMLLILLGFWVLWQAFRTPNLSRSQAARRLYRSLLPDMLTAVRRGQGVRFGEIVLTAAGVASPRGQAGQTGASGGRWSCCRRQPATASARAPA